MDDKMTRRYFLKGGALALGAVAAYELRHPGSQKRAQVERIESRTGLRQLEYMKTLGMSNDQYELITV